MKTFNNKSCGGHEIIEEKGNYALLRNNYTGEYVVAEGLDEKNLCWAMGFYFGNDLTGAVLCFNEKSTKKVEVLTAEKLNHDLTLVAEKYGVSLEQLKRDIYTEVSENNLREDIKTWLEDNGEEVTDELVEKVFDNYKDDATCSLWENIASAYDRIDDDDCPLGGDISNDCADCLYGTDYHFVDGECVRRKED